MAKSTVDAVWTALSATTVTTAICARKGNGLFATGSAPSDDIDCVYLSEGDVVTVEAGVTPYVKADGLGKSCTFITVALGV